MIKNLAFGLLATILFSCAGKYDQYKDVENSADDYAVVPLPAEIETRPGQFVIDEETKIITADSLQKEAQFLADYITAAGGPELSFSNEGDHAIKLQLNDAIADEGYKLDVSYDAVTLSASSAKGIFYGIQTLRQLLPASSDSAQAKTLALPAVSITDAPQYAYRGMHLDVARHMYPVDFVKKYIDLIALHKMNTFHWHLTEDQGWRIEIKKYPKLTEIGGYRDETVVTRDPYTGDGKRYGGFYTQEEIKDVVAYAKDRHITIIPEIEMPGHATAALAAYPEFGNDTGPYKVITTWGVFPSIYAPKEETFAFLEDVLTEVMELFPSEYIHIGGDEAPKTEWENSAQAQEVIKREGLANEHELQSYFIQRIEKFLNKNRRKMMGWDEILEGGLAPNATVMSWRGTEGGIEAAKQNHDVVMTPNGSVYLDYYQADPATEKYGVGPVITVEKIYNYNPTPEELSEEQAKHILGAQANVWTERMPDEDIVEYMAVPRMSALAEVVWSPSEKKDYANFTERMKRMAKIFDEMQVNYAKHMFENAAE